MAWSAAVICTMVTDEAPALAWVGLGARSALWRRVAGAGGGIIKTQASAKTGLHVAKPALAGEGQTNNFAPTIGVIHFARWLDEGARQRYVASNEAKNEQLIT